LRGMGRELNTSSNGRRRSERGDPWEGVERNPNGWTRERTAALGPVAALGEHHGTLALPEHGPRRAPLGGASGDRMAKRCGRLRRGKGGGHPNKRRPLAGSHGLRGKKNFWLNSTAALSSHCNLNVETGEGARHPLAGEKTAGWLQAAELNIRPPF